MSGLLRATGLGSSLLLVRPGQQGTMVSRKRLQMLMQYLCCFSFEHPVSCSSQASQPH